MARRIAADRGQPQSNKELLRDLHLVDFEDLEQYVNYVRTI